MEQPRDLFSLFPPSSDSSEKRFSNSGFCLSQWPSGLRVKTHTQRSGAGRGGAERPAACDLIRGNKAVDLFPKIESQTAGRSAVCVFLP
jgi:hypothetical protein